MIIMLHLHILQEGRVTQAYDFDIMLPKKTGWEVCKEVRSFCSTPIIMVTAKGEEVDRTLGLEPGTDDYKQTLQSKGVYY